MTTQSYEHVFTMQRTQPGGTPYPVDGFSTRAYTESGTYYDARLKNPGVFSWSLWAAGRTRGPRELGYGAVVLENTDGALDTALNDGVDGAATLVERWPYVGAGTGAVFRGYAEQVLPGESEVTVQMRDLLHPLNTSCVPLRYAGTNVLPAGIEGTADDIKGQPKPLLLGRAYNISPVLVNTSLLVYQVDGQQGLLSGWSMTVYDKRIALTAGAVYTNQADMEANAPAAGQYRVWPAGGCFRLGGAPAGQVTCDVENPFSASSAVHFVAGRLLGLLNPLYAVTASVGAIALPDVGVYVASDATYLDVLNTLWASVGAGWFMPGTSATAVSVVEQGYQGVYGVDLGALNESQVMEGGIRRIVSADDDRGVPAWRVNVRYRRNYTVQSAADIAGASAADVAFCSAEYRVAAAEDAAVKTQYARAVEITVDTLLVDEADAAAEAARLLAIYKVRRDMVTVPVPAVEAAGMSLGNALVFRYPRMGFGAGKVMQVIGMEIDCGANTVTLTLWG